MAEGGRMKSRTALRRRWREAAGAIVGLLAIAHRGANAADPCTLSTGDTTVTIGEPTSVCLVVNGLEWVVDGSSKYAQVLIVPDADEFSRFSVTGSWNSTVVALDPLLTIFGTEVGVHVESMGKYSFQKAFRRREDEKTFPLYTAIIAVDSGEVTGISWDDGCHFCGSSNCEENTYGYTGELVRGSGSGKDCFWEDAACTQSEEGKVSTLCQLKVYVVWTGTDSKGNYFTSSSKRLSMYAGETLDDLIGDVSDQYQDTISPNRF